MVQFILNQQEVITRIAKGTLLLDFIRYHQHLMGTKIGCREGDCGACTVLVGEMVEGELRYRSVTSCLMPLGNVQGKHIVTIEGINIPGLNFIQQAFASEGATQCGFCTPGFIVSLAGCCLNKNEVTTASAIAAVNGNICRCTGYKSIERAAATVATKLQERGSVAVLDFAVTQQLVPAYFIQIKQRLQELVKGGNGILLPVAQNKAKFMGGGTDLYVQHHEGLAEEEDIDFLLAKNIGKGITQQGTTGIMGAEVTVTDILESPIFQQNFPALKKHIKLVSATQIRNMATVAGNIINGSPIGDFTIFFLALDAQLVLTDGNNSRQLPLRQLFKGYKSLHKSAEEYIDAIYFQLPAPGAFFNFEKVCKRTHLDIASVNTAIYLEMKEQVITLAGISAGGVGPVPCYLEEGSRLLTGRQLTPQLVDELIEKVQLAITPISDTRGTATYKRLLLAQLIRAHFNTLFPRMDFVQHSS